jgi:hypothetical protein
MRKTGMTIGAIALLGAVSLGGLSGLGGCVSVVSSMPVATNMTGEAWFTETTGIPGLPFSTRVYYCPAPTAPGPAKCTEASYVSKDDQAKSEGAAPKD